LLGENGFGKQITKGLTSLLGNGIGSAVSSLLPGVGSLVGPLIGKITSMFGSAGRDAVKDFAATFKGGFDGPDGLHAALNELGAEGERLWIKLTQGVGKNNPEQARAVIAEVTAALEAHKQKVAEDAAAVEKASEQQAAAIDTVKTAIGAQIDELDKRRQSLMDSIANEAPEEVMGIVEAQTRAQITAIDLQKAALETQLENQQNLAQQAVSAVTEAVKQMASDIREVWRDPLTITYRFQQAGDGPSIGAIPMASGGIGRIEKPTLFLAGEAGPEDFAFSGGGRSFAMAGGGGLDPAALEGLERKLDSIDRSLRSTIPALVENAARFGAGTSGQRR
jgi:hypothetical protein